MLQEYLSQMEAADYSLPASEILFHEEGRPWESKLGGCPYLRTQDDYPIRGKMYACIGIDDRNGRPIVTLKRGYFFIQIICKVTKLKKVAAHIDEQDKIVCSISKELPGKVINTYWTNPLDDNWIGSMSILWTKKVERLCHLFSPKY